MPLIFCRTLPLIVYLKGNQNWKSITDPVNRNEIKDTCIAFGCVLLPHFHVLCVNYHLKKLQRHGHECCQFVTSSLYQWCHFINNAGLCGKYIMSHFFFFKVWFVKSQPTWLHPKELTFKAKQYFCLFVCISIDKTTKLSVFLGQLASLVWFSFNQHVEKSAGVCSSCLLVSSCD